QAVAIADELRREAVDERVALLLVHLEVALRVERDRPPAAPVGVDAQDDLLRHRARRKEERGLLVQHLGNARLEARDDRVGRLVGADALEELREHAARHAARRAVKREGADRRRRTAEDVVHATDATMPFASRVRGAPDFGRWRTRAHADAEDGWRGV